MIAFLFPGQGSQKPGMGVPWRSHPSWELVEQAADATGADVEALLCDADADALKDTRNSQLSTFVMSMLVLDAVERVGVEPSLAAGHSLGEYSALVAAGAFSFEEGALLVKARGDAMAGAAMARPGAMAAVLGMDVDAVHAVCETITGEVWIANDNAPGQVVISGSPASVEEAGEACRTAGAKRVMKVPVGGAFHTPLMEPAVDELRVALDAIEIRDPEMPVIANLDASAHPRADDWPKILEKHLYSPVRWRECMLEMTNRGAGVFVELGPGSVLTAISRRVAPDAMTMSISTPEHLDALLEQIAHRDRRPVEHFDGEHLYATERLVVAPVAGLFRSAGDLVEGDPIDVGAVVGTVGDLEVRSVFAGTVMGRLAIDGERVANQQPVLWLRSN